MIIDVKKTLVSKVLFPFLIGLSAEIGKQVGSKLNKKTEESLKTRKEVKAQ